MPLYSVARKQTCWNCNVMVASPLLSQTKGLETSAPSRSKSPVTDMSTAGARGQMTTVVSLLGSIFPDTAKAKNQGEYSWSGVWREGSAKLSGLHPLKPPRLQPLTVPFRSDAEKLHQLRRKHDSGSDRPEKPKLQQKLIPQDKTCTC